MIKKIRLINFKSFKDTQLDIGQLTLLLGTNAAGKSNLRDAFRFLHGIGRGYSIADIIGVKYSESGDPVWNGIRGGSREIVFSDEKSFTLEVDININLFQISRLARYHIEVDPGYNNRPSRVISEWLRFEDETVNSYIFRADNPHGNTGMSRAWVRKTHGDDIEHSRLYIYSPMPDFEEINNSIIKGNRSENDPRNNAYAYDNIINLRPAITQISESSNQFIRPLIRHILHEFLANLSSLRFLDLNPDSMRKPSFPGQNILTDQGSNLSSVLLDICSEPQRKDILIDWLQALTPMDTADFEFTYDQRGYVLVNLVESNGRKTSAYSASDGTLRFLAMLAALLGPETARCYFFEELDNGIHPTRLHLLIQLIEQHVAQGSTQVISTTHSPQLLRLVSANTLDSTSIVYRLPDRSYSQVKRLYEIPEIQSVLKQDNPARLFESGWFEDTMIFASNEDSI